MDAFKKLLGINSPNSQPSPEEQQALNDENQRQREQDKTDEKNTEIFREKLVTKYLSEIQNIKTTIKTRDKKSGKVISTEEVAIPAHVAKAFIETYQKSFSFFKGRLQDSNTVLDTNKFDRTDSEIYHSLSSGNSRKLINEILSEIHQEMNL